MATDDKTLSPAPRLEADGAALLAPLEAVLPGRNARSSWDTVDEKLVQLAESIQEQGILEPLLVRELHGRSGGRPGTGGRRFELIAGFRRFAAAKYLSLDRVPVRLLRASDEEALALNLAENLARADLDDSDALRSVVQLQDTYGWGVRKIGRATGRSASWVSEILAVARSRPEREAVESGRLAVGGAARLARLKDEFPEVRDALLKRIESGEQVLIGDVPRLTELRQSPESAPQSVRSQAEAGPSERTIEDQRSAGETARVSEGAGTVPPPNASWRIEMPQTQLPPRQVLELTRQDKSLVHNAGTLMHQTLTALYSAWTKQGFESVLPTDVRETLRRTAEEIETLLARENSSPA